MGTMLTISIDPRRYRISLTVDLCVASIPKRIESSGEGGDPSGESQSNEGSKTEAEYRHDKCFEKELELLAGHKPSDDFDKSDQL